MTDNRSPRERAVKAAKDILQDQDIRSIPVSVMAIAANLGVRVVHKLLDDETSAFLVIKDDQATIAVNKNHHQNRQRFSIAHELGHYCLHRGDSAVFVDTKLAFFRNANSSRGEFKNEIAANAFAAELLMPEKFLEEYLPYIDLHNELSIRSLALKFEVSEQALTIRLANLLDERSQS
jgi:Zn-dependent peptidase ImmA (M78 family)